MLFSQPNNMLSICKSARTFEKFAKTLKCGYSTAATQTNTADRLQTFRTTENNPVNHTSGQLGQFYTLPTDIKQQLFLYGGLPKTFETQAKTFNETCVMVREPALDIINCIKSLDFTMPCVRFVLYGKKGTGKSLTMAHMLHYGFNTGFLLVHVPWVGNWMRRTKDYSNSELKEGFIDINLDAAAWLLHFKTQNAQLLSKPEFVLSHDIVWNKRETTLRDSPLLEIIEHGINRVKFASQTVNVLAKEIKRLARENKCKVLVAVDGYNAFFYPYTRILTEKKEVVHPSKVTVTEAFLELTKFDWNNAVAVLTVDEIAIAEKDQISYLPK